MLILSAPAPAASGVTPNIVVTRQAAVSGESADADVRMRALIDKQVEQMTAQLAGFRETSRRIDLTDVGAVGELRVEWHNAQAQLTQNLTFVDDGPHGVMIATATTGRGEYAEAEPTFRHMLKSFRIT